MYTLVRQLSGRSLVTTHLPALGAALLIAEGYFKFGSFSLECLAFLATWFTLDAAWSALLGRLGLRAESTGPAGASPE
jgi:hypothetical protein